MRRNPTRLLVLLCLGVAWVGAREPGAGRADASTIWLRPVAGPVVRPFRAPLTPYGPGHLGADLAAVARSAVRAAGDGTVVFAGVVAGTRHVVLSHPGNLRTSYSFLASILVRSGQAVARGTVLGTAGGRSPAHDGDVLHLGLRIGDAYVDPMQLFVAPDLGAIVHLAPVPVRSPGATTGFRLADQRSGLARGLRSDAVTVGGSAAVPVVVPVGAGSPPALSDLVGFDLVGAGRRAPSGARMFPR